MAKDRLNFEEAYKELQVSEEELEQLVANGEIACVKEGNDLFFKKDVISQFKKTRKTEPTIILTEEDMGILDGMEEIQIGGKPEDAAPVIEPAAKEVPEPVMPELEGMEDIVIEPRGAKDADTTPVASEGGAPDETVLNLEGLLEDDGSEGTTPIPGTEASARSVDESTDITVEGNVTDETLLDTDTNLLEVGEEEDSFKLDAGAGDDALTEPAETALLRGGGARAMQMKRRKSHAPFTVALVFTALVFLAPLAVTLNTLFTTKGGKIDPKNISWIFDANGYVGGIIEGIADLF